MLFSEFIAGLPSVRRVGRVETVLDKSNPITLTLSDGTQLFLTHDEFRRLPSPPRPGQTVEVTFLRLPGDAGPAPSTVTSFKILA